MSSDALVTSSDALLRVAVHLLRVHLRCGFYMLVLLPLSYLSCISLLKFIKTGLTQCEQSEGSKWKKIKVEEKRTQKEDDEGQRKTEKVILHTESTTQMQASKVPSRKPSGQKD